MSRLVTKPKNKGGRPKGFDKLRAHMRLRELVQASLDEMTKAQIANAKGISYLVWRDKKTGKFRPVPSPEEAKALSEQGEVLEVWPEKPNVAAFADLLDRTLDKAAQPVKQEVTGDVAYRITWRKHE